MSNGSQCECEIEKRRSVLIGFSSGIGVGIGWRDSYAASQFTQFSNSNFSGKTFPSLKDRMLQMKGDIMGDADKPSADKTE